MSNIKDWKVNPVEQFYNGNKAFEINFGNDGECIAEVVHGIENAQLMSASPELLEALVDLLKWSAHLPDAANEEIIKAKSAIFKAVGL